MNRYESRRTGCPDRRSLWSNIDDARNRCLFPSTDGVPTTRKLLRRQQHPDNAASSQYLTFAHSGTVVNDKGSDIFVISHFDSLFVVISLNLVVYRRERDLWNDDGFFYEEKDRLRTSRNEQCANDLFKSVGFEDFGFDVVFYEHVFWGHFKWQLKRLLWSAGQANHINPKL